MTQSFWPWDGIVIEAARTFSLNRIFYGFGQKFEKSISANLWIFNPWRTLDAYIVRFVCASDMVDGALDFLGVQHFHNGKLGSIRYAIVSHLNKKVSRFDAIFAKFFAIRWWIQRKPTNRRNFGFQTMITFDLWELWKNRKYVKCSWGYELFDDRNFWTHRIFYGCRIFYMWHTI